MPSDRRFVLIPVDNPTVTHATVTLSRPLNGTLESEDVGEIDVPVPPDDQLTRDLADACEALEAAAAEERYDERNCRRNSAYDQWRHQAAEADIHAERAAGLEAKVARLRAAFRLEERPSLDDVLAHGRARFGLDEGNES